MGLHVAPEPASVPTLLARFASAYSSPMLAKTQRRILAIGAAHHRLAWILPFMDGNGRVMRLFSHLLLKELGMRSELWSVSRGLALHVERYKALLQAADEPRRGPLDGRGSLTESGLAGRLRADSAAIRRERPHYCGLAGLSVPLGRAPGAGRSDRNCLNFSFRRAEPVWPFRATAPTTR